MKIQLVTTEWYPVWEIDERLEPVRITGRYVNVDRETLERWQRGYQAFQELQDEIGEYAKKHEVES